jgi:hypothetical protein
MKTNLVFPLAALGLLASAALFLSSSEPLATATSARIVDLPAIAVYPSTQDSAYLRTHRIVDLPRITVRPDPADLASWLADSNARVEVSVWEGQATAGASDALAAR